MTLQARAHGRSLRFRVSGSGLEFRVGISYIVKIKRGSHLVTLGPRYILIIWLHRPFELGRNAEANLGDI